MYVCVCVKNRVGFVNSNYFIISPGVTGALLVSRRDQPVDASRWAGSASVAFYLWGEPAGVVLDVTGGSDARVQMAGFGDHPGRIVGRCMYVLEPRYMYTYVCMLFG